MSQVNMITEWLLSFPEDQIRYLLLFLLSLFLGFLFRRYLSYSKTPLLIRWLYHLVLGLTFCVYCFGVWDTLIIVSLVGVAFIILQTTPLKYITWIMLIYALSCSILIHFVCMKRNYGSWKLNINGPVMMIAQKITYVACELVDGLARPDDELTDDQRRLKIMQRPSLLQFFSYSFSFVGILAGPTCSYKDYANYITGDNMVRIDNPNQFAKAKEHNHDPSPLIPVTSKFFRAVFFLALYLVTSIIVTKDSLLMETGTRKIILTFVLMFHIRTMYYFTFIITEAVCNASGLGFTGYNEKGVAQWDMVTGMNVIGVEFPVNSRELIASWNMMTATWLRRCVFERTKFSPAFITFIVSSLWHGVYPGYYLTFLLFYCGKTAANKVRRQFHHYFQKSDSLKLFYDVITTISTCVYRDIVVIPFIFLTTEDFVKGWSNLFFLPIVMCFLLLLIPGKSRGTQSKAHKD